MTKKLCKVDLLTEDEVDIIIKSLYSFCVKKSFETQAGTEPDLTKELELIRRFKNAKDGIHGN